MRRKILTGIARRAVRLQQQSFLCYSVSLPRLVIVSDMTQTCEKQLSTVSKYRTCHYLTTDVSSTRKDMTTGASDVNSRCGKWTCAFSYVSRTNAAEVISQQHFVVAHTNNRNHCDIMPTRRQLRPLHERSAVPAASPAACVQRISSVDKTTEIHMLCNSVDITNKNCLPRQRLLTLRDRFKQLISQ